jgi:competence protein ComEC
MDNRGFFVLTVNGLIFLNLLAWSAVYLVSTAPPLKVVFFDVGQGDAILIKVGYLYQVLIDGGPGRKVLAGLSREMPWWDKRIDLIILTHPEKDHLEGLIGVLDSYEVENIVWTGVSKDTQLFQQWLRSVEQEDAKVRIAKAGQRIFVSLAKINVLYPLENLEGSKVRNVNRTSVVTKLCFGQTSFLFPGDIYSSDERKLIEKGFDLDANVLKLAHHGSKTSNSELFIQAVSPNIAVAQVGENNKYHHPHESVLETLEKYDVKLLRTDQQGDIKIISNGENLIVNQN